MHQLTYFKPLPLTYTTDYLTKAYKGVFGCGTKWNGMSWFHSTRMGRFRLCVCLSTVDGMEWLHFGVWLERLNRMNLIPLTIIYNSTRKYK